MQEEVYQWFRLIADEDKGVLAGIAQLHKEVKAMAATVQTIAADLAQVKTAVAAVAAQVLALQQQIAAQQAGGASPSDLADWDAQLQGVITGLNAVATPPAPSPATP